MQSFEGVYYEIGGRFDKVFHLSSDGLRAIGISLPVIACIGAYLATYSKFEALCTHERDTYLEIDNVEERLEKARKWSFISLDFSTLVIGFQLAFMIPASKFLDPEPIWIIFENRMRTLQVQICQNSSQNWLEVFKSKFEASSIGSDVIKGSNAPLFRVVNVLGITNIVMMLLVGAQFLVTLYKFPGKIMMREIVVVSVIVATLAFGIFEVARGQRLDVGPDLRNSWNACFLEYNKTK